VSGQKFKGHASSFWKHGPYIYGMAHGPTCGDELDFVGCKQKKHHGAMSEGKAQSNILPW